MVRQGRSRTKRGRGDIIMGIESDSFTENVQPWHDFRVHTKRRRKFKRMAIGDERWNLPAFVCVIFSASLYVRLLHIKFIVDICYVICAKCVNVNCQGRVWR